MLDRIDLILAALYTEFTLTGNKMGMLQEELLLVLPGFGRGDIKAMNIPEGQCDNDEQRVWMVDRGWENAHRQGLSPCIPLLNIVERAVWEHLIHKTTDATAPGRASIDELVNLLACKGATSGHIMAIAGKPVRSVSLTLDGADVVGDDRDLGHFRLHSTALDNLLGWPDIGARYAEVIDIGRRICQLRGLGEDALGLEVAAADSPGPGDQAVGELGATETSCPSVPEDVRMAILNEAYFRFMGSQKLDGFVDPVDALAGKFDQLVVHREVEYLVDSGLLTGSPSFGLGRPSWHVHITPAGLLDIESHSGEMGLPGELGEEAERRRIRLLEWFEACASWTSQQNMPQELTGDERFRHDVWFLAEAGFIEADNARNVFAGVQARITTEGRIMLENIRAKPRRTVSWKPTPWAFISSPEKEMEDMRDAARDGALSARVLPVGMESFAARPVPSIETCYSELEKCDVVVLLVGHRYGSVHPVSGKAFTELEYDRAVERGIPVLAFVSKSVTVDPQGLDTADLARLQDFKSRLQKAERVTYAEFSSGQELEKLVLQSLRDWRDEELRT